ncbi:MAG: hypothetical protein HC784_02075 [Hydrococcus sp. CSU_1_8]|nr:hypothetical protein [Hydrococcus sp. CSU_1_8]
MSGNPSNDKNFVAIARSHHLIELAIYIARKRLGIEAIKIPSGHYPHLSHPIRLAEVLNAIAS